MLPLRVPFLETGFIQPAGDTSDLVDGQIALPIRVENGSQEFMVIDDWCSGVDILQFRGAHKHNDRMKSDTLEIREDFLQGIHMCPVLFNGIPELRFLVVYRLRPVLRALVSVNPAAEVLGLDNEDPRTGDDEVVNLSRSCAGPNQQIVDDRKLLVRKSA